MRELEASPSTIVDPDYERILTEFTPVIPNTSKDVPIDELVEMRKNRFHRLDAHRKATEVHDVHVHLDGPVGLAFFGDPHIDDDGCDIATLERHLEVLKKTPGLFAGNLGDMNNNWVGRLAALYNKQGTTEREAWRLVEWMMRSVNWLYVIDGNHDGAWSGDKNPLQWMIDRARTIRSNDAGRVRLRLNFPNGKQILLNARHNFPGNSMWNNAHAVGRAAQMGVDDHIIGAGHIHCSGHMYIKQKMTGRITHAIQVASYKKYDNFAEVKLGKDDGRIFVCPMVVIDPRFEDDDPRLIHFIPDPEEGAEYLTWKRGRKTI